MNRSIPRNIAAALAAAVLLASLPAPAANRENAPRKTTRPKRPPSPALKPIQDAPGLPWVLLIGDSISIGYTLPTRKLLAGEVNLHRVPTNGGDTARGLASLDAWLGKGKWDAIHFNWGLHDLKRLKEGKLDSGGDQVRGIADYEKNLRELTERLKKSGAKLIWCTTTPVPAGSGGRTKGDAAKYNQAAAKVMAELKVPVNDLYAFALPRLKQIQRPANVHFTPAGSEALARQVANAILKALGKPPLPAPAEEKPPKEK